MPIWNQDKINKKEDKQASSKTFNEIKKESGVIPSIISDGTEFKGNVKTSAEIQIDGGLNGNVKADKVLIGINGNVRGNITANFLRICGKNSTVCKFCKCSNQSSIQSTPAASRGATTASE